MTQIDQFESVFRAAAHDAFVYTPIDFKRVLVVTDTGPEETQSFLGQIKDYAACLNRPEVDWEVLTGDEFQTASELLDKVEAHDPDLICTYRNLHSEAWQFRHSLGEQLDILLQRSVAPVLVMPHPRAGFAHDTALADTQVVMAITDHLTNNHGLVNHAVCFVKSGGELYLTHIEDEEVFERYIDAISKIPSIDTDEARERLARQLLQDPKRYIDSCRSVLDTHGLALPIHSIVEFGHHLRQYQTAVEAHQVNLLVMNTKDDDQLAMHGLAYPLAVELRQLPLLML